MPAQYRHFSLFLFFYFAHAGTFITYAALFFAARGMSVPQIGVLLALVQVMRILGPNLWGWVADHSGQRVMVLRLTGCAALLSFGGMFVADSFPEFIIAMVMLNLFTSAQTPLGEALMLTEMRGDLSHYGRVRLWGSIGFIVAVSAAGYLLEWFGVDALPTIAGLLLMMVVCASLALPNTAPGATAHARAPLLQVMRAPGVWSFFVSVALMCAAHMALYAFYSLYLERAGYSKAVIGMMWALGVMAEVVFFYFQARVFARFSARSVMLVAFGVAVLRFTIIGAGADFLWVLIAAQMMHAVTFGAHHSALVQTMQTWFSGPLQARGQALYTSIGYGIGGTLGGLFMSACWDKISPEAMFYAAAGLALAGMGAAALSFGSQAGATRGKIA